MRTSGNISFISAKFAKILPKSAAFQITKTTPKGTVDGVTTTDYSIKVTYGSKDEAVRDKTGKSVKELVLHLLQLSRPVNGRPIHDFSFDTKDFEKMADRDFEVVSYF